MGRHRDCPKARSLSRLQHQRMQGEAEAQEDVVAGVDELLTIHRVVYKTLQTVFTTLF